MKDRGQSGQRKPGRGETRAPQFLIANLELEFDLSPIRISNLKFSNRKFFAIFYPEARRVYAGIRRIRPRAILLLRQLASHSSLITHHCPPNRDTAIKIPR